MKYKDYYAILEVARESSDEEIRKAYRRLARKYHPDISKEADAEDQFKAVNEAYQTLSDPDKRKAYNQLGRHKPGEDFRPTPEWDTQFWQGAGGEDIDLADLFEQMGFRTVQRRHKADGRFSMRGQDYEDVAVINLEDASRGTDVALNLLVPETAADGTQRRVSRSIRIRVPKGVIDGERLRVPGRGGPGIGEGPPGDLYLDIRLQPHRLFKAVGHDLYLEVPITPWEAVLGASIEVPTLNGQLQVTIRAGSRGGQKLRLAGKGLPTRKGGAGDLYCVLQVVTPSEISDRERELYQELASLSHFYPRANFAAEPTHE